MPDLIHPFHVAALRRYCRYLIGTGAIELGDRQSSRRYVAYNEPVARFFHRAITARLSALAREPVKPSYVYLASYLSGTELRKHTDREQCEFSVTFSSTFLRSPNSRLHGLFNWRLPRERSPSTRLWAMDSLIGEHGCRTTGEN